MNHEDLIASLEYISQVKSRLAEESTQMTEKLNNVKENLAEIILENNTKQADVIEVLQEVQAKLQNFPNVVANQQSLLQTRMIAVMTKMQQLNQNMLEQREELTPPIEAINDYFDQFEEQLATMGENHLQILAQGINTYNKLWSNLETQNNTIDIAWEATEQEIEILGQKVNYFQDLIQEQINLVEDDLESAKENINDEIEAVFEQQLPELEIKLTENIQQNLEQIVNQIEQFSDRNGSNLEQYQQSLSVTDNDFQNLINDSFAPVDEQRQHIEQLHDWLSQTTEEISSENQNLQASCLETIDTLDSINN